MARALVPVSSVNALVHVQNLSSPASGSVRGAECVLSRAPSMVCVWACVSVCEGSVCVCKRLPKRSLREICTVLNLVVACRRNRKSTSWSSSTWTTPWWGTSYPSRTGDLPDIPLSSTLGVCGKCKHPFMSVEQQCSSDGRAPLAFLLLVRHPCLRRHH